MRKSLRNEKGFTLIELVMVIVILGILAATAIPKFVDLQGSAKASVSDGITAALRGAVTMLHAQYLINNTTYGGTEILASIDADGVDPAMAFVDPNFTGNGSTWAYTAQTGNTAGKIGDPS
jgi:MSHA pilin protein MshA